MHEIAKVLFAPQRIHSITFSVDSVHLYIDNPFIEEKDREERGGRVWERERKRRARRKNSIKIQIENVFNWTQRWWQKVTNEQMSDKNTRKRSIRILMWSRCSSLTINYSLFVYWLTTNVPSQYDIGIKYQLIGSDRSSLSSWCRTLAICHMVSSECGIKFAGKIPVVLRLSRPIHHWITWKRYEQKKIVRIYSRDTYREFYGLSIIVCVCCVSQRSRTSFIDVESHPAIIHFHLKIFRHVQRAQQTYCVMVS